MIELTIKHPGALLGTEQFEITPAQASIVRQLLATPKSNRATATIARRESSGNWWVTMTTPSGKATMRSALSRTAAIQRAALFLTYQSERRSNAVVALDLLTQEIEDEFTAQLEKEVPAE